MTGLGIASYPFISNMVAQRHASQVVKDYETNVEEMDEEKIDAMKEAAKKYNEQLSNVVSVDDENENRYVAAHHPFTSPNLEDVDKLMSDPAHCYSRAYDLVLNGYELLSGSIRIHDQKLQEKVFEAIGMTLEEAHEKFSWFMDAFQYGTPPHGGVGIGLERLTMILAGTDNIRDVVAFPKTASASDLMAQAPSPVDAAQLKELGIETK